MLQVNHISTGYGKKQILFDISLKIKSHEVVLLIGSNGSGKSTLLKAIYGLLPLWNNTVTQAGQIIFKNENITNAKPSSLIRKKLLYVPQKNNTFDDLTLRENLEISGLSLSNKKLFHERYQKVIKMFPMLESLQKQKPLKISGGERQLLTLAMATLHEPEMLLMDEPFAGLSSQNTQVVQKQIMQLNKDSGTTFLIVEHKIKESFRIASKVIALKNGKFFTEKVIDSSFNINELNSVFI